MKENRDSWYIHINQAVRKYGKTRQTFYNYINKGYVQSKKVNNKVFLLIEDIENILNDYIPLDRSTTKNDTAWAENQSEVIPDIIIEGENQMPHSNSIQQEESISNILTYKLQSLFESFSSWFDRQITHIENEIVSSNKRNINAQIHNIQTYLENKHRSHQREIADMKRILRWQHEKNKKLSFWIYYLVFVSLNIFILRFISS